MKADSINVKTAQPKFGLKRIVVEKNLVEEVEKIKNELFKLGDDYTDCFISRIGPQSISLTLQRTTTKAKYFTLNRYYRAEGEAISDPQVLKYLTPDRTIEEKAENPRFIFENGIWEYPHKETHKEIFVATVQKLIDKLNINLVNEHLGRKFSENPAVSESERISVLNQEIVNALPVPCSISDRQAIKNINQLLIDTEGAVIFDKQNGKRQTDKLCLFNVDDTDW